MVTGNTGPAHLAAAVGTPVACLFSPVVPAIRWAPYGVPLELLGDQNAACRLTRARICPVPGHPCLDSVSPEEVVAAVERLIGGVSSFSTHVSTRRKARQPMRILLWHVHGSWTDAFVRGRHEYLLPVLPDGGPWGLGRAGRDWPASVQEVDLATLDAGSVDAVVPATAGRNQRSRPGPGPDPRAWTCPRSSWSTTRPRVISPSPCTRWRTRTPSPWCTSPTSTSSPGTTDQPCPQSSSTASPTPGSSTRGSCRTWRVVVNEPVRRGRVTGTDLLPAFAAVAPLQVFGMETEGLAAAAGIGTDRLTPRGDLKTQELHRELARCRVYLHPMRWTSLGLSLLEAMHLGMPVVVLATTEAPRAVPPEAGVVSADIDELLRCARRLLADPDEARRRGVAAREAALARYGLGKFQDSWDGLLADLATQRPRPATGPTGRSSFRRKRGRPHENRDDLRTRQPAGGPGRRRRRRAERPRGRTVRSAGQARPPGHRVHPQGRDGASRPRKGGTRFRGGPRGRRPCPARSQGRAAAVHGRAGRRRGRRTGTSGPRTWSTDTSGCPAWPPSTPPDGPAPGTASPCVQTFHALGTVKRRHQGAEDTSPPERRWLEPGVGRSADRIIATCSDEVFELKAMGIDPAKISIAPCGVDLDVFGPDGPVDAEARSAPDPVGGPAGAAQGRGPGDPRPAAPARSGLRRRRTPHRWRWRGLTCP